MNAQYGSQLVQTDNKSSKTISVSACLVGVLSFNLQLPVVWVQEGGKALLFPIAQEMWNAGYKKKILNGKIS